MQRLFRPLVVASIATATGADAALPPHCQEAADQFCAESCYPQIKSRPCPGPLVAADAAGGPHGGGWKCYSPSCLSSNHSKYVGGGCFCSDDTQIRAVLHKQPGCTPPAPAPPPIPFGFAKALGNEMVLAAAPKQAMVWGFCDKGASVQVVLDGGPEIQATIGPDQATGALTTWKVKLPATKASFTNHTISASSAGKTVSLQNVWFGEVWLCSGQSNMEYPIGSPTCWNASNINCTSGGAQCGFGCSQDAGQTIKDMASYDAGMRLFNVGGGSSITPQAEMRGGEWKTPSSMGGTFSATCWFYGRDIYNAMSQKVPVGLISTFVGGTPIQHWTSPEGLATCDGPHSWNWAAGFMDSVLWNAMVVPLLRTVHSGVVWYQVYTHDALHRADLTQPCVAVLQLN